MIMPDIDTACPVAFRSGTGGAFAARKGHVQVPDQG